MQFSIKVGLFSSVRPRLVKRCPEDPKYLKNALQLTIVLNIYLERTLNTEMI